MCFEKLRDKALSLPLSPGVYIMKDKDDCVIYVGKAKKLKNRVSQYFQDTASHTPKTRLMVSKIDHFDVIVADSEFEALVLECSLIKRYQPKYNILLKDDKGYPYLRINMSEAFPVITMVSKISDDGANYYGPFGSRGMTQSVLDTIQSTLKLPRCKKKFPRDIGKARPCLNYHMNECAGWCQNKNAGDEYQMVIKQAKQLLQGNYKAVAEQIRQQMHDAAEALNFEVAARMRDRLSAVEALGKKQLVIAGFNGDTDVIGYAQTETKACFSVLHFTDGCLLDKDYEVFPVPEDAESAVSSLMKQYYLSRGFAPKIIILPFKIDDSELFEHLLQQRFNKTIRIKVPQRGDNARLAALAVKNAQEEADRVTDKDARISGALSMLGKMIAAEPPKRIESFDISNLSGTDMVASMVVFQDGRPKRSSYKRFKIKGLEGQDDYASMYQVIKRRFTHLYQKDKGFDVNPDLLLIDGGIAHARTAADAVADVGLDLLILGMVKDDRHRTRALVTPDGKEIRIDSQQAVFALVGSIQEETHRFAVNFHRKLRSKRLHYSELDTIKGIGPKRKQMLLKVFKSLNAIGSASLPELEKYLPRDAAAEVYKHFRDKKGD